MATRVSIVKHSLSIVCLTLIAAISLTLSGCSDGQADHFVISGQVLIDGEPVSGGDIKFVPRGGRPSGGTIENDGRFTLTCYDGEPGVIPGAHRVEIVCSEIISATTMRWNAPRKYANFLTSGLEFEVNESNDSLEINLTWGKGKPFVEKILAGEGR